MPDIPKIIKTVPKLGADVFEKALKCDKFWEACITGLDKVSVKSTGDGKMHWELRAYFMLDPLGVTKIPVDVRQDMLYKEDKNFKGEGKRYMFTVENSNAASEGEGNLFFKASSKTETKIMVEVTKLSLKSDFLDIAGLGKSLVVNRLTQELQKMVTTLIELADQGKVAAILAKC
nr:hypothetical protein [Candidatus Sigynarchaeota archaeon]